MNTFSTVLSHAVSDLFADREVKVAEHAIEVFETPSWRVWTPSQNGRARFVLSFRKFGEKFEVQASLDDEMLDKDSWHGVHGFCAFSRMYETVDQVIEALPKIKKAFETACESNWSLSDFSNETVRDVLGLAYYGA